MKRAAIGLSIVCAMASGAAEAAPPTTEKGARATLTTASGSATITVNETATLAGPPSRSASLKLVTGEQTETVTCTYTMSQDPVLYGIAQLDATCAPYDVVANFTINGGGTGNFGIVCRADFSRPSQTVVEVTRAGETVASGMTTDSRVWTNVDLGTCED
jgi:hypothetical protein